MHKEFLTIYELVAYALQEKSASNLPKGICQMGLVSEALSQRIQKIVGLDVTNYHFLLEHAAIRHILKRHGKDAKEQLHG